MRKYRSLALSLAVVGLAILGYWILYGGDQRASIAILADGDFFGPELRVGGRPVPAPVQDRGPWQFYAWANLNPGIGVKDAVLSWTNADGSRRTLRDVLVHEDEGFPRHCAYLLRLDAAGDPIPPSPGLPADRLTRFCHD